MDEAMKLKLSEAGMTDAIETIEGLEKDLSTEKEGREADTKAHEEAIKTKDEIIEKKNQDLAGARRKYKKLADMTEEERNELSEKERELLERQEKLEEDKKKSDEERAEREAKERNDAIDRVIKQKVGENEELAERVKNNIDRIKDADTLVTETEIETLVGDAYNMLGEPAPEGPGTVLGSDRGDAPGGKEGDFADSSQGKDLASRMGLAQSREEGGEQK